MRKRLASILLAGAAAAAAVTLVASSASAAGTWTISPGGSFTAVLTSGTRAVFTDATSGSTVTCTSVSVNGTFNSGSGLSDPLGIITKITWGNCGGPDGSTGSVAGNASPSAPWGINGESYSSGVTTGMITASGTGIGITISLTAPILGSCSITATGAAANPASANVTYTNSTGVLAISGATNLVGTAVSGACPGVADSQSWTFTDSFTLSPKQGITSP
jgi:hypothetical protein